MAKDVHTRRIEKAEPRDAKPLHEELIAKGFSPYHKLADREDLSLKENCTKYVMQLEKRTPTVSFHVDGYIINEGNKCDYIVMAQSDVRKNRWTEILVELKGTDVKKAIEQLESSLNADILKNGLIESLKARLVALSFPSHKSNPVLEKARRRFERVYKCELKTVKSGQPDKI